MANGTVNGVLDAEVARLVDEHFAEVMVRAVKMALHEREPALVAEMVEVIRASQGKESPVPAAEVRGEWTGIESLSRLRSVVGGRFQNIKKKWTDAGFPLREHRGDKWQEYTLDKDGWVELACWIAKQGFEARLTPESREFLFELRQAAKKE